jgi:hypothetical protein
MMSVQWFPTTNGWVAECGCCHFVGPYGDTKEESIGACAGLAYFDPRDSLPTPEEEAAHRKRHGEGAGWMVRIRWHGDDWERWADVRTLGDTDEDDETDIETYPHINGRPVAWPEVSDE